MELTTAQRPRTAIVVAFAMQLAALASAWTALSLVEIDLRMTSGNSTTRSTWSWAWWPLLLAMPTLWILLGFVTARVARNNVYWATVWIAPGALICLWVVSGIVP